MATIRVAVAKLTVPGATGTPTIRIAKITIAVPQSSGNVGYAGGYDISGYGYGTQVNATITGPVARTTAAGLAGSVQATVSNRSVTIAGAVATVRVGSGTPTVNGQQTVVVPVTVLFRSPDRSSTQDLSAYVTQAGIQIGSTSPQESNVPAGTCTLVVDDVDGVFDPNNTQSPIHGWLVPRSQTSVFVYATQAGVEHPLFAGGVESVERTWPGGQTYSQTTIDLVDFTKDATRHKPAVPKPGVYSRPAELAGARISALLTSPSRSGQTLVVRTRTGGGTLIDTGQKVLGPYRFDGNTSTWDAMALAAYSEAGKLYVNGAGQIVFHGQQYRATSAGSAFTLGDNDGEIPYQDDTRWRLSDDSTVDDVAKAIFDGSIAGVWGPNGSSTSDGGGDATMLQSLDAVLSYAAHEYLTNSTPKRHVEQVTVDAGADSPRTSSDSGYLLALTVDLDDKVTLIRRPPGGGDTLSADYFVDGIAHDIGPDHWLVTLTLSPAPVSGTYWRLGKSKLGSTTKLTW